jgi:hypothetical protein
VWGSEHPQSGGCFASPERHNRAVQIRIAIVDTDPPSGQVSVDHDGAATGDARPFSGWLGLLSVLYDLLPSAPVVGD